MSVRATSSAYATHAKLAIAKGDGDREGGEGGEGEMADETGHESCCRCRCRVLLLLLSSSPSLSLLLPCSLVLVPSSSRSPLPLPAPAPAPAALFTKRSWPHVKQPAAAVKRRSGHKVRQSVFTPSSARPAIINRGKSICKPGAVVVVVVVVVVGKPANRDTVPRVLAMLSKNSRRNPIRKSRTRLHSQNNQKPSRPPKVATVGGLSTKRLNFMVMALNCCVGCVGLSVSLPLSCAKPRGRTDRCSSSSSS